MTLQGTNEFIFNQATMREIVAHYLATKMMMLAAGQIIEVANVEATKPSYGPEEFRVTIRCAAPSTEEKKP